MLSGTEALAIFGSSKFMAWERHNALLKTFLADAAKLPVRKGKRLFVGGSPLDNAALYALIEASGATVVGENHYWGNRCAEYPLRTDVSPLDAVADHHHAVPTDVDLSDCRGHRANVHGGLLPRSQMARSSASIASTIIRAGKLRTR